MDLLSQTKHLVKQTGLAPDKLRGQNFCVDQVVLEQMVSSISRAANRQNTVQQADFSASDPFHREVETLANNAWLESGRGRWFYERARGSWLAAEQKASYRTTEQRAFREQTPKARRFGNKDGQNRRENRSGHRRNSPSGE